MATESTKNETTDIRINQVMNSVKELNLEFVKFIKQESHKDGVDLREAFEQYQKYYLQCFEDAPISMITEPQTNVSSKKGRVKGKTKPNGTVACPGLGNKFQFEPLTVIEIVSLAKIEPTQPKFPSRVQFRPGGINNLAGLGKDLQLKAHNPPRPFRN